MAGEILISPLVDQVSNDLITSKIIMTITVLYTVFLFEIKKKHRLFFVSIAVSLDVVRTLPSPFSIFIRFSANFTSIAPSGTTSSVLDNIRIIVRLHVFCEYIIINLWKELFLHVLMMSVLLCNPHNYIFTNLIIFHRLSWPYQWKQFVRMFQSKSKFYKFQFKLHLCIRRSGDIQERVECRVNGTSRQQITASNPGNITKIIFSALHAEGYIVQETTVISGKL